MSRKLGCGLDPRKLWTLSVAGLFFAATIGAQEAAIVAHEAWVRVPLPSKTETALFMVIENHSPQRRAVVSASSDAARTVEMHEMKMVRTAMYMTPVAQIPIPAKGKTKLDENGFHLMLFGLKSRPAPGDQITVTLKLDDGTAIPVTAVVRK
jgi:periplasmic copper chaperone A